MRGIAHEHGASDGAEGGHKVLRAHRGGENSDQCPLALTAIVVNEERLDRRSDVRGGNDVGERYVWIGERNSTELLASRVSVFIPDVAVMGLDMVRSQPTQGGEDLGQSTGDPAEDCDVSGPLPRRPSRGQERSQSRPRLTQCAGLASRGIV